MLLLIAATSVCAVMTLCHGSILEQPGIGQGTTTSASSDPFVGRWKLNPARSKASDEMKVTGAGENKYNFDFGGGNPETIVLDGSDQAGMAGTTLAVSVEGPNAWRVVRKFGGRTAIDAKWELSADGNTLTDHFGSVQGDGSIKRTDYIYKRTAGQAGFAGTWENTTGPSAFEVEIEPFEGDGLSFINVGQKSTRSLKFDGKDYPVQGPNIPTGFVSSGHRANGSTLQFTEKIGEKTYDTQQAEVSADHKTLTMTVKPSGQSRARIYVFERE